MSKVNIQKNASTLLACNKDLKAVFMTSDGLGFSTKSKANTHQKAIDATQEIQEFKRPEASKPAAKKPAAKKPAAKKPAKKK